MTLQQKALKAAELLTAWANGKALQYLAGGQWHDLLGPQIPSFWSAYIEQWELSDWRIKPESRRMWTLGRGVGSKETVWDTTSRKEIADQWKAAGHEVIEWVEVV